MQDLNGATGRGTEKVTSNPSEALNPSIPPCHSHYWLHTQPPQEFAAASQMPPCSSTSAGICFELPADILQGNSLQGSREIIVNSSQASL